MDRVSALISTFNYFEAVYLFHCFDLCYRLIYELLYVYVIPLLALMVLSSTDKNYDLIIVRDLALLPEEIFKVTGGTILFSSSLSGKFPWDLMSF